MKVKRLCPAKSPTDVTITMRGILGSLYDSRRPFAVVFVLDLLICLSVSFTTSTAMALTSRVQGYKGSGAQVLDLKALQEV